MATVTNVLGQQTGQIQYAGTSAVSGSVVSGGGPQVTAMSYDAAGNKSNLTDPAGHSWTYGYGMLGRQVKQVDPDTGTSVTGYDAAGNVTYTTNGAGVSDNYVYDALNRKTAEYTGSTTPGSGILAATWVWDTSIAGMLLTTEALVTDKPEKELAEAGHPSCPLTRRLPARARRAASRPEPRVLGGFASARRATASPAGRRRTATPGRRCAWKPGETVFAAAMALGEPQPT